jgi:hypothetical protein
MPAVAGVLLCAVAGYLGITLIQGMAGFVMIPYDAIRKWLDRHK